MTSTASIDLDAVAALRELLDAGNVVALTGAGISTESGIPDYRGPSGALRNALPMTIQTFVGDPSARHRYWARGYLGWRRIRDAVPNAGHRAVAAWQQDGRLGTVITQNVDGLHRAAGATDVVELHGALSRVICLSCGAGESRAALDDRLAAANPGFAVEQVGIRPDGDVELSEEQVAAFCMVPCLVCGTDALKPDVVYFGENVPRERVQRCLDAVDAASALLVLGSSLTVMSGLRFVRRAAKNGTPVVIVNQGPTRGDALAQRRIDAPLGAMLAAV